MEEYKLNQAGNEKKRPDLLTLLCVLTFIGSGMGAFSNFVFAANYSFIIDMADSGELSFPGLDIYLSLPQSFYVFSAILYFASLVGAVQMWKLRKIGFHIYTSAQILLLLVPVIYPQFDSFPFLGLVVTAIFVALYGRHLKYMS